MRMKSKYWIILTCLVVLCVSIYLTLGIKNELTNNSYLSNSSITNSQSSVSNSTHSTNNAYRNGNNSDLSISNVQTYYNKLIESKIVG